MTREQAYDWLALKLSDAERSALDIIFMPAPSADERKVEDARLLATHVRLAATLEQAADWIHFDREAFSELYREAKKQESYGVIN